MDRERAVVLLSGGLDSATCLAMAVDRGYDCYALSFDYGQRHTAELDAAHRVADMLGAVEHRIMTIGLGGIGGSALTDPSIAVPEEPGEGIPETYVPARNTVFLSLALGWAEVLDAGSVFIGVNAVDFSGYPDCRPDYIAAYQAMANLATKRSIEGRSIRIEAPLIDLSKTDIIDVGTSLGVDYAQTVSCYQADDTGRACGLCDACRLRRSGFDSSGIPDPTPYVTGMDSAAKQTHQA
jgi:7-cyano-7-deazaguanine synthase